MPKLPIAKIGAALSVATLALTPSVSVAADGLLRNSLKPVIAKLLILPGNNIPTGKTDLDSLTREVNFSGTLEGSSSHSSGQSNRKSIFSDDLVRIALGTSNKRKALKIQRKVKTSKTQSSKVAKYTSRKRKLKKYAPLMLGVYR